MKTIIILRHQETITPDDDLAADAAAIFASLSQDDQDDCLAFMADLIAHQGDEE